MPSRSAPAPDHQLLTVPAGRFTMGTDEEYRWKGDGESPARQIELGEYRIAPHAVSNRAFAAFVDDTGFVTDAERFEWSFVFHMVLPDDFPDTRAVAATPWWRQVYGADWAHPAGPSRPPRWNESPSAAFVSTSSTPRHCVRRREPRC